MCIFITFFIVLLNLWTLDYWKFFDFDQKNQIQSHILINDDLADDGEGI